MHNILFVGGIYETEKRPEYLQKSQTGLNNAVDTHQWNLIHSLDLAYPEALRIVSGRFLPDYPTYRDFYVRRHYFSHRDKNANLDCNIGFINIFGFKQLHRKIQMKRYVGRWLETWDAGEAAEIVCYYLNVPFMNAAVAAAKRRPTLRLTLVVPDAPAFLVLSEKKSLKQRITAHFSDTAIQKLLARFDRYILLTESMREILPVADKPCLIMEGIVSEEDAVSMAALEKKDYTDKSIVYAGSLHRVYGVGILLDAFALLPDQDATLNIFGAGELEAEIKKRAQADSRIRFHGYQSRETVLDAQRRARVLVNPRPNDGAFNRYSFPSKNLEYLLSGTAVIAAKLPGMPAEYESVIHLLDAMDVTSLREALFDNFKKNHEQLADEAKAGLAFALEHKGIRAQSKRLRAFIDR